MEMMRCRACKRRVGWGTGRDKEGVATGRRQRGHALWWAGDVQTRGSLGEMYLLRNKNRETIKTVK
jgi:hypothetical protein